MIKYLFLLVILLTVGCANQELLQNEKEIERNQAKTQDRAASIKTGSYSIDNLPVSLIKQAIDPDMLADQLDEDVLTGQYFLHNGSGKLGYGVTGGFIENNEMVNITLMSQGSLTEVKDPLLVTLYHVDEDMKLTEVKQTKFTDLTIDNELTLTAFAVPEDIGVYLVYLTFINEEGQMIDQLIQLLYQLKPVRHASLSLEESVANETLVLSLENHAVIPISLGMHYQIEQKISGIWYEVPLDLAFIEIQLTLDHNQVHEQAIAISQLASGDYRVVKSFYDLMNHQQTTLAKEFSVNK